VEAEPRFADGWSNYGAALRESGRMDEAIAALERAVKLAPLAANAVSNLGIAYLSRNRFYEAIACQRRALELKPDSAEALTQLANALAGVGRWEEAEAAYRTAIEWQPGYPDAHNNLGMLRSERGDVAGAAASFRAALDLKPDFADATQNLGFLLQQEGRAGEAIELYRRALVSDPRNARAAYNLGIALVSRQEFAEGWELCERRFDTLPPVTIRRAFAVPALEARDLGAGRRIAVWKEQGVGDQILYATLLAELAARGERFVAEIDARLIPAFRRAHPDWQVVTPEESAAAFAQCDRHIAIGSLPRLLRRTLDSFEKQPQALLKPPSPLGEGRGEGRPRLGISWRTFQPKVRGELGKRKSSSLAAFLALSRAADLVDLQYGETADERDAFAKAGGRLERIEGLDLFNDLDGLLGAIEGCDAVVTTSNVTAHLAGSIGKRALVMFLHGRPPFHYWASPGARSLWYPSVEIVTGPDIDTWDKAVAKAHERIG
jgi:tetratricopeptide (TPR) repeat protein